MPAGNYEVVTDEELIEGVSFPVYRRVATMMLAPTQTSHSISRPQWNAIHWPSKAKGVMEIRLLAEERAKQVPKPEQK